MNPSEASYVPLFSAVSRYDANDPCGFIGCGAFKAVLAEGAEWYEAEQSERYILAFRFSLGDGMSSSRGEGGVAFAAGMALKAAVLGQGDEYKEAFRRGPIVTSPLNGTYTRSAARGGGGRITDPSRLLPERAGPTGHIAPREVAGRTPTQNRCAGARIGPLSHSGRILLADAARTSILRPACNGFSRIPTQARLTGM